MSTTFEFTSAPSDVSVPSFDPAIAAFADMSFTQPPVPSPFMQEKSSLPPAAGTSQPECFQRRDLHDKKRFKADPDTPALDSIDYWINFDDDLDRMGSFEIDYSKRNDSTFNRQASPFPPTLFLSRARGPLPACRWPRASIDSGGEQIWRDDEHGAGPGERPLLHRHGAL